MKKYLVKYQTELEPFKLCALHLDPNDMNFVSNKDLMDFIVLNAKKQLNIDIFKVIDYKLLGGE